MTDLVEFLTARLDEAEAAANGRYTANPLAPPVDVSMEGGWVTVSRRGSSISQTMSQDEYFSTYLVPAPDKRTLADIAAKRRIVERYREAMATASERDDLDPNTHALLVAFLWPLYDLGTVYADHPDYNPEWKP